MTTRTLKTAKGMTITTTLTDDQAVERLANLVSSGKVTGDFGADLVRKARGRGLTENQMPWVHKLVIDATSKVEVEAIDLGVIRDRLVLARSNGKAWPKLGLRTEDGQRVELKLTGARSSRPETVNVTDGRPFGQNSWFGRIERDGTWRPTVKTTADVVELLKGFASDPEGKAAAHGHLFDSCCFCGKGLSTDESVAAGYGPKCAKLHGLPWGDTAALAAKQAAATGADVTNAELQRLDPGTDAEVADVEDEALRYGRFVAPLGAEAEGAQTAAVAVAPRTGSWAEAEAEVEVEELSGRRHDQDVLDDLDDLINGMGLC